MDNINPKYWHQLVETLAQGIAIINKEGEILYCNDYAAKLFGLNKDQLIGSNFFYPLAIESIQEVEILKTKGEIRTVQMIVKEGAWHNQFAWIVALFDMTEFKNKERELTIASKGINAALEGILITDNNGQIIKTNQSFLNMLNLKLVDVFNCNVQTFLSDRFDLKYYKNLFKKLLHAGHWRGEVFFINQEKNEIPTYATISVLKDEEGNVDNFIGFFHDLRLIKNTEKQLKQTQYYDLLTGLPNKMLLTEKLQHLMNKHPNGSQKLIVFSIRIYGADNDYLNYGKNNKTRDLIILQTVNRITQIAGKNVFIARIGFNEFIVVFNQKKLSDSMASIANKILRSLSIPYRIYRKIYSIQAIIGIATYPNNSEFSGEELLRHAEIARHKARQEGGNLFEFYNNNLELEIIEFNHHLALLRHAIEFNQLKLYFQPKVDLKSEKVLGFEALLRWKHPDRGLLKPAEFLSGLDNHPIALELGNWVLKNVLDTLKILFDNNFKVPISINMSSYQLKDSNFINNLNEILEDYPRYFTKYIIFEILETEALEDLKFVSKILTKCRQKGIVFSLDDFGTGYSSLTYLKELNTAEVKLDQSFIRDMLTKPKDLAILKTIIELCKLINRILVAEGVQTMIHGKLLFHIGLYKIQGYAIAKPMPFSKVINWLNTWKLDPEWKKNRFKKKEVNELISATIKHYLQFNRMQQALQAKRKYEKLIPFDKCLITHWFEKYQLKFKNEPVFSSLWKLHKDEHDLLIKVLKLIELKNKKNALNVLRKLNKVRRIFLKKMICAIFD